MSVGWFESLSCGAERTGVEMKPAAGGGLWPAFRTARLPAETPVLPTVESNPFGGTVRGSRAAPQFTTAEADGFTSGADPGEYTAA